MNNKKNWCLLFLLVITFCCVIGCGNRLTKITGTVQFSDGTPITYGRIVFDDGKHSYFGTIKNDGTYITGGINPVEGIPDGVYKIWLASTEKTVDEVYDNDNQLISYSTVEQVAEKFRYVDKTDLVFEVKRGGPTTYNVVVEKP
ncbi:MAG: hypothetical protein LBE18_00390 [Planctomycetaceae bacterium]|jgi:hypothetical protein|nr:hypothetical protein [Planctomycetaceae bacterium]